MVETGWKDGNALKFGQYSELELEFSPPTTEVEVFVECRGRWGLQHNGFCIDATTLEQIAAPREGGRPDTALIEPVGTDILSNGAFEDLTRNPENLTPDQDSNHYQQGFIRRSNSSWSPNDWPSWWVAGKGIPEFTVPQQPIKEKIHAGQRAMGVFRQFEHFHGGWWQQVGVEPGATYRLEGWCRIWCTHDENPPFMRGTPGEINAGIGLTSDPSPYPEPNRAAQNIASFEGGKIDAPPNLEKRVEADWHIQDWQKLSLDFVAGGNRIGIIPYADGPHGFRTQDVYFDDLSVFKLADADSQPDDDSNGDTEPVSTAHNVLQNSNFAGSVYRPKPILPNLEVPENWTIWYAGTRTPRVQGQEEAWRDPKSGVITPDNASSDDSAAFTDGVARVFRVVGAWRAIWWALTQKVVGLEPNQPYLFSLRLLADPVLSYGAGGEKSYTNRAEAGEIWLKSVSAGRKTETLLRVHNDFEAGKYILLKHEFTLAHSTADITIEIRSRLALVYNAWYLAEASLWRM